MWQELKGKIQSEVPRYNKVSTTPQAPTNQKIKFPPKNKNKYKYAKNISCVLPFFRDGMPKGNQKPSSKGGGNEELRNRAKSAHNPLISSKMSTKICP